MRYATKHSFLSTIYTIDKVSLAKIKQGEQFDPQSMPRFNLNATKYFFLNQDSHSHYIIKQAEYHLRFKNHRVTNYFNLTEPQEGPTAWTGSAGWAFAHRAPLE